MNSSHGCPQVRALFSPLSCNHFMDAYFEQRHHLVRRSAAASTFADAGGFGQHLLRVADVTHMADHWQFKVGADHSQARLLRPDSFSHDDTWPEGSLLDAAALARASRLNRTVVLHNVELYWRPIGALSLALMRTFGLYAQANVYLSPPGLASAVHAHQDAQSVFILQCEGRKRWELFEAPQRWRLRYNQRGKAGDVAPAAELTTKLGVFDLSAGDVLFVPRGIYHRTSTALPAEKLPSAAGATGEAASVPPSLHVTIGIETDTDDWTWISLLKSVASALSIPQAERLLDAAQWHDEKLRQALPLPLCMRAGSFTDEPYGPAWLSRAQDAVRLHLRTRPEPRSLQEALDASLRTRQEYVERKREQIIQFMEMSPSKRRA